MREAVDSFASFAHHGQGLTVRIMSVYACLMWESQLRVREALLPVRHSIQRKIAHPTFYASNSNMQCSALSIPRLKKCTTPLYSSA